jgi:5'-deoxynucleotidase YfbR-like HD superfamily hydrolase
MNSINSFYKQIYNLAHIDRYSTVPRITHESVAEHSFFVAALVIRLHKDYEFDLGVATTMAIMHDWTESWLDDITVPTKRQFPLIAAAVLAAESYIAHREFPQPILELWLEHKECITVESQIVHYADVLQCMQYAQHEVRIGNNGYMQTVVEETHERLQILERQLIGYKRENQ